MYRCVHLDVVRRRVAAFVFVTVATLLVRAPVASAQFAEWVSPVDGLWTDGSRWSTAPNFPNGSFTNARIAALPDPYTVTVDANITVNRLELVSGTATLRLAAGGSLHMGTSSLVTNGANLHLTGGSVTLAPGGGTNALRFDNGRMSLGAGTVSPAVIEARPSAQLVQTGGWLQSGPLLLFDGSSYTMSGGTCQPGNLAVGGGTGAASTFHQTGGTFGATFSPFIHVRNGSMLVEGPTAMTNISDIEIGTGSASLGTTTIRGGARALIEHGFVGLNGGNGTLQVDSGARLELRTALLGGGQFGSSQPGTGTIHLTGGEIVGLISSNYRIGATTLGSSGTLRIDGGTLDAQGVVTVNGPGSGAGQGTVLMSGGVVRAALFRVMGVFEKSAGDFRADLDVLNGRVLHGGGSSTIASATLNNATTGTFVISGGTFGVGSFFQSAGAIAVTGGAYHAGRTTMLGGSLTFSGGALHAGALDVFAGQVHIAAGGDKVPRATSVSIGGAGGRVDLSDNAMHVNYSGATPIASVRGLVASGHAGGAWTGDGLTSSAAAANAGRALGYAEAAALPTIPSVFGAVDDTSVLIRYTRYGDADLNRIVNLDDFNRLAAHFGGTNKFWHEGDFNYDATVNLDDFNLLAASFGMSAAGPHVTSGDWATLAAAVPEPACALVLFAGAALLSRRRVHQTLIESHPRP